MAKIFVAALMAAVWMISCFGIAQAADPLVSVEWLKANKDKQDVVLLDIRAAKQFEEGHIPGSVNSPYGGKSGWRQDKAVGPDEKKDVVKGVLPPVEYMEKLISKAGVSNGDHVVVIAEGSDAADIGAGTRVYWTMRVLGEDNVSLLDGGLLAWTADKSNPLAKGKVEVKASTFKANLDTRFLATADDVRAAAKTGNLIDSRPTDQFLGVTKSGAVTRFGHVPGAKTLPSMWLTKNNKGFFRDKTAAEKLYNYAEAPAVDGSVTYCNTGHWASLGWFVDYAIMGKQNAKMYDGSMSEWSRLDNAPMEAALDVN